MDSPYSFLYYFLSWIHEKKILLLELKRSGQRQDPYVNNCRAQSRAVTKHHNLDHRGVCKHEWDGDLWQPHWQVIRDSESPRTGRTLGDQSAAPRCSEADSISVGWRQLSSVVLRPDLSDPPDPSAPPWLAPRLRLAAGFIYLLLYINTDGCDALHGLLHLHKRFSKVQSKQC